MKAVIYILTAGSLMGCVSSPAPLGRNHPANPQAETSSKPRPVFDLNASPGQTSPVAKEPSEHTEHAHSKSHE